MDWPRHRCPAPESPGCTLAGCGLFVLCAAAAAVLLLWGWAEFLRG